MRRGTSRAAIALLLLLGAGTARAERALPKTHAALLDSVAGLAASDLLRGGPIPPGHAVRIATPLVGDTLGFLGQRLVEQLRRGGTEVRLIPARAEAGGADPAVKEDSTDLVLNVEVKSAGVSYVRAIHKFPAGIRGYERLATLQAGASLLDPATREVLWARTVSQRAGDVVRRADLSYAQLGSASLVPLPPRAGGGTRLLEPLIVVGVVTGLVVLFYSNRN